MAQAGIVRAFRIYFRALREVRAFWPSLGLILGLGLAWIPVSLVLPLPLKILVDNLLGGQPLASFIEQLIPRTVATDHAKLLALTIGLSIALALLGIAHKLVDWLLREIIADRMVHGFRGGLLFHGLRLPTLHHTANGTLDLGYRINQDAPALQWTAIYGIIPVLISLTTIASTLYVIAIISAKLALIALATSLPMIALVHGCQHRLKVMWHAAKEQDSAAQSIVHEVLGSLRVVTLFGQERRETERFLTQSRRSVAARLRAMRMEGFLGALLSLATALGTAGILYLGVRDVEGHVLSVGDLLVVITYIGQLYAPLQAIGTHVTGQQHAVASVERAFAVLDQPLTIADRPDAQPLQRARGAIAFREVSFSYDHRNRVIDNADFTIPAGKCVGIVGRTGAGKTTLINLLIRLFDPNQGKIMLDGVDLREWRLADLRRQFAVVPQDPTLFSTSIAENIAYGRPDAPLSEIIAAAEQGNAHDFIAALPQGYDTAVGERGMRLSGGERQRIALARAFLTDAPVIILDEPTSAVDRHTEAAIVEGLERLRRGRTTLVIAHRLATLRRVDMRLCVEDGHVIVEQEEVSEFLIGLRKVS